MEFSAFRRIDDRRRAFGVITDDNVGKITLEPVVIIVRQNTAVHTPLVAEIDLFAPLACTHDVRVFVNIEYKICLFRRVTHRIEYLHLHPSVVSTMK